MRKFGEIKYPSEYGEDKMDVFYKQSEQTDEQFLYYATKK